MVLPLAPLAGMPSVYSVNAEPLLAFAGALITAVVTFAAMRLWSVPLSATYLLGVAAWVTLVAGLDPQGILLFAGLITGATLVVCLRRGLREDHLLVVSAALPLATVVALFALAGAIHGFDPFARLATLARHLVETSLHVVRETRFSHGPLTRGQSQFLAELWEKAPRWTWLLAANGAVIFCLALLVATRAIRRWLPLSGDRVPPFATFSVGEIYVYPVIALCLVDVAAVVWDLAPLRLVADNALWILLNIYWVAGLAVCHGLMVQLRFGILLRLWCWVVLVIFAQFLVAAVGLFDTWFQFRGLVARWLARHRAP
jgi:hypothetical protein